MAGRFARFVATSEEALPKLPLFHSCDGYSFRSILATDQILPNHCGVFGEALLYFFYGRPAYRPRPLKEARAVSQPAFLPVCIMVRPDVPMIPARIAPFDTGAFSANMFSSYVHPGMACADFLVEPSADMPARLVKVFFGTNHKYFYGNVDKVDIPALEFEAKSYYDLLTNNAASLEDDRRQTIEVQTRDAINLMGKNVMLVVLPTVFLDDEEVRNALVRWAVEVRSYNSFHCATGEYTSKIYSLIEDFLAKEGYI